MVLQVQAEIFVKTKENPFIALLMLAQEKERQGNPSINATDVQEYLFPPLPEKACLNILDRLKYQGYFKFRTAPSFVTTLPREEELQDQFVLTELGKENARDKSIWQGEKGIYNLYISDTPFVPQRLVWYERVSRGEENDKEEFVVNKSASLKEIDKYDEFYLSNGNIKITLDKQSKYFDLGDEKWQLDIIAQPNQKTEIKFSGDKEKRLVADLELGYDTIFDEIFTQSIPAYDKTIKAIRVNYSPNDISFVRTTQLTKPTLQKVEFDDTSIKNINYVPNNQEEAGKWCFELLRKGIDRYFTTDNEFSTYYDTQIAKFKPHYNFNTLSRQAFAGMLNGNKEYFYPKAKLDTIDFLSF